MLSSLRINDEEDHERDGISTLSHVGLGEQVITRVGIHCFGIAYVGPVQIEDEVAEGREWEDSDVLLLHESFFLWRYHILRLSAILLYTISKGLSKLEELNYRICVFQIFGVGRLMSSYLFFGNTTTHSVGMLRDLVYIAR
jgi:hypothetical protein